ncbi:MAG: RHS repeat-associated core domain-containing protein [Bacteroidota bacterium]
MKNQILVAFAILISATAFSQNKSFTEKLNGIKTSSKELTKNSATDNASIGQTGTMSTSIPLVEIKSRSMSFPLQLQYSSGITVNQSSSDVGLGWVMPLGSIVRDYGAFEPDYTSTIGELFMQSTIQNGQTGHLNTFPVQINPTTHNQVLGFNGVRVGNNFGLSDEYHVSVPGSINNTFWNQGETNQPHSWVFQDFERYKVDFTRKTFTISQEFSRINELNANKISDIAAADKTTFDQNSSYAAAIGMLPYVIDGLASIPGPGFAASFSETHVTYQDFEKFIITDDNGVRYVFGRPLRGQKYIFNDDPYWTTHPTPDISQSSLGHFWKIDYIAEWLLTEILSPDYSDLNNNGKADDSDAGDWIRFEYTEPTKVEASTFTGDHLKLNQEVPMHRTWSNFSQTDPASSLMREIAYLTKIVTPLQEIDLSISQRMEVDHDFYSKPANKIGDEFYYEDREYNHNFNEGSPTDFDVSYPVETMKYDNIKIYSRLFDPIHYPEENALQGSVVLNYAAKGSEQELAVSNYLIRNNENQDKLIDKPSSTDFNIESYYSETIKRGKTTLLGIDFFDSELNPGTVTSYKFEYDYNPSLNEIHKREIARKYFFPSIRQAFYHNSAADYIPDIENEVPIAYSESILGADGYSYTQQLHTCSPITSPSCIKPSEFLIDFPYKEVYKKYTNIANSTINSFVEDGFQFSADPIFETIQHPLKPVMDVYGFLYAENCTKCPEAWSLTKITYPQGGTISFEYEQGEFEKAEDNPNWSIGENNIPLIKPYNDLAEERSAKQDLYNRYVDNTNFAVDNNFRKTLTASYQVDLPEKYGIRLKKKTVNDQLNPPVSTFYEYNEGHFTSLPADYLTNYLEGFNNFIIREKFRHSINERNLYPLLLEQYLENWTTDYEERMSYLVFSGLAMDDYFSTFYYDHIDERQIDNSKIRSYFGTSSNLPTYLTYDVYASRLHSTATAGRFILGGDNLFADNIVPLKTEFFEAGSTIPYRSEQYTYSDIVISSRNIYFNYGTATPGDPTNNQLELWNNVFEYWVPLQGNVTPLAYFNQDIYVGPFETPVIYWQNQNGTENGKAFAYDHSESITSSFSLNQPLGTSNFYPKWGVTKRLMIKKEENYKGMLTTTEYTYNPVAYELIEEKLSSNTSNEVRFTTYEYAHQTYDNLTNKFQDLNLYNFPTKTTRYLYSINPINAISAEMITYDFNLAVPKIKNTFQYKSGLNVDGTFTLVPFNINSNVNPNWKITEAQSLDYNKQGNPISARVNRLYSKSIGGYGQTTVKAQFSSPDQYFDATYSGFEDLYGRQYIGEWESKSYKDEIWYSQVLDETDLTALSSFDGQYNPCDYLIPPGNTNEFNRYKNMITLSDVTGLEVGDEVVLELIPSQHADINGLLNYSYTTTKIISGIYNKADVINSIAHDAPWYTVANPYVICFTELVEFPNSTYIYDAPGSLAGEVEVNCPPNVDGPCYYDPNAIYTISETKITKRDIEYTISEGARTGKHSYKLESVRDVEILPKVTPLRPVKIISTGSVNNQCNGSGTLPESCYWKYEASVWLKQDGDIQSQENSSNLYLRGEVTESNDNQGFKIICKIWNQDRTSLLATKTFYPQGINTAWRQYTVQVPILKSSEDQWLDVYIENSRNQVNASPNARKSLYVDDILIYPASAKYSYTILDNFGNIRYDINNDDVFVETTYDDRGRIATQKNAYGKIMTEMEYFSQADWNVSNNYFNQRNWVSNGVYNETRVYLDGFGKTKQAMISDLNRNLRIVSETNLFDSKGRILKSYKPYYINGSTLASKYDNQYQQLTQGVYNSSFAFTEMRYEDVPEEKLNALKKPHYNNEIDVFSSQQDYLSNSAITNPHTAVNYPAGSLLVRELTNELGHKTKSYVDFLGRVILEEKEIGFEHAQNTNGSISLTNLEFHIAQTWFTYDGLGRLIKVYDPEGKVSEYNYNSLGQLLKSITPDKGTNEARYDKFNQLRFYKNAKDIEATTNGYYDTDQFKYIKYDPWGRVIESGMRLAITGERSNEPDFIINPDVFNTDFFIEEQNFPNSNSPLIELHHAFEYDGLRKDYSSSSILKEFVYSEHILNPNFTVTIQKTDQTLYRYATDGQIKDMRYNYQDLPGEHLISIEYNSHRIPIGKNYIHPTNNFYRFYWRKSIDNLGRVKSNQAIHNNITQQTGKYFYDAMGNVIMTGLGTTNLATDPHIDYLYVRRNIRDQVVNLMSKNFRMGLQYDHIGNITNQFWSNEQFDPVSQSSSQINEYEYYYDRLNRLTGADYKKHIVSTNPFTYFNTMKASIPTDFDCFWNIDPVDGPIQKEMKFLMENLKNGIDEALSKTSLNTLGIVQREYQKLEVAYELLSPNERTNFLKKYIQECKTANENVLAYELVKSKAEKDDAHYNLINTIQVNKAKPEHLKYTVELLKKISAIGAYVCLPNEVSTVYGVLPEFNFPEAEVTDSYYPYDEAFWYSKNGNINILHRNDNNGLKSRLTYNYSTPTNNQLNAVTWAIPGNLPFTHNYNYDLNGNLLNDPRNGITQINYNNFDDLPQSITNSGNEKKYRYDARNNRCVKDISSSDKEFYIDDVVLDQTGNVKSYQTPEGYAVPIIANNTINYFYNIKDWQGTTRVVVNSSGTVLNSADHYTYGKRLPGRFQISDNEGDRYQFTGHEFDGESGYEYHGARYYNEELGRYMSVDPLASQAFDWSPYRYAFDNPIMYVDQNGMFESRSEARNYKREHGIRGRIRKDADGQYNISNRWTGEYWSKGTQWEIENGYADRDGIVKGAFKIEERKFYVSPERVDAYNSYLPDGQKFFRWNFQGLSLNKKEYNRLVSGFRVFRQEKIRQLSSNDPQYMHSGAAGEADWVWQSVMPMPKIGIFGGAAAKGVGLSDEVAKTFRFGRYTEVTLDQPLVLSRYYDNVNAFAKGKYMTNSTSSSVFMDRMGLALKPSWNNMSKIAHWEIPAGTTIYRGRAAMQFPWIGGKTQYFVPDISTLKRVR